MKFNLVGHNYLNEIQNIIQVFDNFFDDSNIQICYFESILDNNICISNYYKNNLIISSIKMPIGNFLPKDVVKICMYKLLVQITNFSPPWGTLTGVRPAKIIGKLLSQGLSNQKIFEKLHFDYFVDSDKVDLCFQIYNRQVDIINSKIASSLALYIGIPFCPTKCKYCSFTSFLISKHKDVVDQYLDCLYKELLYIKPYLDRNTLKTIYIGGGTPTSIDESQLEKLLYFVTSTLNLDNLSEFTVEAGRPDTITKNKLHILQKYNVNRISINPQTTNDKTLQKIGRNHTVEEFFEKYYMAKDFGFETINVDVIVGLIDENIYDIQNTMSDLLQLSPKNVTIHTLSIKRASDLKTNISDYKFADFCQIKNMLSYAQNYLKNLNLKPYYLYRQKNILGNLENIGYSEVGFECLYNIQTMEEKHTIIAIGAGAISKIVDTSKDQITRIFNVKDLDQYLLRIDEMLFRKKFLLE